MHIAEIDLVFGSLQSLGTVERIILHHAEWNNCTVEDIHRSHKGRGWSGIGYHFFIKKDGSIYRGRPEGKLGAHTSNKNSGSIGVCFEGKYNVDTMPVTQLKAGQELIAHLRNKYGLAVSDVFRHKDFNATSCPGNNFPFTEIVNVSSATSDNAISKLQAELNKQGFKDMYNCNLKVDGLVGPKTLSACPTLKKGAEGNITKIMQELVGNISADGIFGANTLARVKEYQIANGLVADGMVGQKTWSKLLY